MTPAELRASSFASYNAGGRALAVEHLALLQRMPLALLGSWLVELRRFDTLFPPETARLRTQLTAMETQPQLLQLFTAFTLPPELARVDWLENPGAFVSALASALWATGQIDAYHRAAEALFAALPAAAPAQPGGRPPLLLAVFGRGARPGMYPVFQRLASYGTILRKVNDVGALEALTARLQGRAASAPGVYAHWYVDGGAPLPMQADARAVEQFSFPGVAPVTDAVLAAMNRAVEQGTGPELLADRLRELPPSSLGLEQVTNDRCVGGLILTLLTQGSGTQLYSTSFVGAAAVELLRRAQPQTLLVRFAPRRKPASMNDMLEERPQSVQLDADGALIDADMATYYAWLALQRSPGGEKAGMVAYVEGQGLAFVAGPAVTRGVESATALGMEQVLGLV